MKDKEMITIQMTVEEAKEFWNTLQEVLVLLEDAEEAVEDLFDMILPVIIELEEGPKEMENMNQKEEDTEKSDCENCTLPCMANPNFLKDEKAAIPHDDSEETIAKRKAFLSMYRELLLEELMKLAPNL